MPKEPYEWLSIEPCWDSRAGVIAYGHGHWPESSVLAGYPMRCYLKWFATKEEAQAAYPTARVVDGSTRVDFELPHTPPAWFDEADAGERWDDDY